MALHHRVTAAPIVLSAAVLAGCGSSGSSSASGPSATGGSPSAAGTPTQTPYQIVAASTSKTASSNADVAIDGTIKAAAQTLPLKGMGVVDFQSKRAALTLTLPQVGELEVRTIGTTIYERLPAQLTRGAGGKPWLKIDLAEVAKATGGNAQQLSQLGQSSDPAQSLKYLSAASDSVTTVGKEPVRGVASTHYKLTVDLAKSAQKSGLGQSAITSFKKLYGTTTFPMDVWIDAQGRATRVAYSLTTSAVSVAFNEEIYNFGKADISTATTPPAAQTQDISSLAGKAAGGTTG